MNHKISVRLSSHRSLKYQLLPRSGSENVIAKKNRNNRIFSVYFVAEWCKIVQLDNIDYYDLHTAFQNDNYQPKGNRINQYLLSRDADSGESFRLGLTFPQ